MATKSRIQVMLEQAIESRNGAHDHALGAQLNPHAIQALQTAALLDATLLQALVLEDIRRMMRRDRDREILAERLCAATSSDMGALVKAAMQARLAFDPHHPMRKELEGALEPFILKGTKP